MRGAGGSGGPSSAPVGGTGSYRIRPITEDDWELLRDLRVEMLRDTPKAFLERLDTALRRTDREWRRRTARDAADRGSRRFVVEADGRLVGVMGVYRDAAGRATVFGVYVTPAWRSRGVAEELLAVVEAEAVETFGADALYLLVHEDNPRARAFYRRQGFVETGRTLPYELDPSEREIEMRRPVGTGQACKNGQPG
jgi:ribosomal protein S18 acetylase RimI-like enzyme